MGGKEDVASEVVTLSAGFKPYTVESDPLSAFPRSRLAETCWMKFLKAGGGFFKFDPLLPCRKRKKIPSSPRGEVDRDAHCVATSTLSCGRFGDSLGL